MGLIYDKTKQEYEDELIVVCSRKGAKSYETIADLLEEWSDEKSGEYANPSATKEPDAFDWEAAKKDLIETECGITLCRQDYFEGDKKHFTFDEALEIEKEAKKHGFRLPTVKDFDKLYAFYGVDDSGTDTPQRLVDELGFSYAGYYNATPLNGLGSYGGYWSSSVSNTNYGYRLYFDSSSVYPQYYYNKSSGFAIKFIYEGERNEIAE